MKTKKRERTGGGGGVAEAAKTRENAGGGGGGGGSEVSAHARALEDDMRLLEDAGAAVRMRSAAKERRRRRRAEERDDDGDADANDGRERGAEEEIDRLDERMARKVLRTARKQLDERGDADETPPRGVRFGDVRTVAPSAAEALDMEDDGNDDDDDDDDEDDEEIEDIELDDEQLEYLDASKFSAEDDAALALFQSAATASHGGEQAPPRATLGEVIEQKLREAEQRQKMREAAHARRQDPLQRKVEEVYDAVGKLMKRYTAGKVPKAFKIIPSCDNWEELLWRTRPDEWSPASVFVATRLFTSNLEQRRAQKFFNAVLLPRAREDIAEHGRLHFAIYQSLKKALFKPKAFFKGVLFPLCEDRSATLREATIVGSVVAKVSVPMLHSAAALMRIATMPYSGVNSLFVRVLLDKKYALPYRVIDALVEHFCAMERDERAMTVLWHQSLLTFAQRYKMQLTAEQKRRLKPLMRAHTHASITPEVRRELFSSRSRGEQRDPDANTIAMEIANAV